MLAFNYIWDRFVNLSREKAQIRGTKPWWPYWNFHFWLCCFNSLRACSITIYKGLKLSFRDIDIKFDSKVALNLILGGCNGRYPFYL